MSNLVPSVDMDKRAATGTVFRLKSGVSITLVMPFIVNALPLEFIAVELDSYQYIPDGLHLLSSVKYSIPAAPTPGYPHYLFDNPTHLAVGVALFNGTWYFYRAFSIS
jgi:hypothetical protein